MVFALILIWVVFQTLTEGAFLQARNLSNLMRQMAVTGILAVGMVLVIVARHIDLSVGSLVAFLGAVLAVLNGQKGLDPWASLGIAMLIGALVGGAHGFLVAYQRIPAFIVTLGGMMIFRGASMWITENSTIPLPESSMSGLGTAYLSVIHGWILTALVVAMLVGWQVWQRFRFRKAGLGLDSWAGEAVKSVFGILVLIAGMKVLGEYQGIPYPVLLMLILMGMLHLGAIRTIWGRHIFALGGNAEAAHLSGIPVALRSLSLFVLMGVLSAIAGAVLTARVGSASPDAGQLLELDAIASCVIGGTSLMGGRGSIPGAILGALVMESLNNGMSLANMEPFWQYIIKGGVLMMAVWMDRLSTERTQA
jgi:D-xylose transport system permease protein